ncbi:MarR family winged helix-turn-helix transcriptional regulator [Mesorhizobium sp. INR15]|uniref:MarR family winged helix-turn-helix transcriptional regulator n=1 Tax=Mesorhizobium sp. INR15 TaxID=2654248 RepID=UPI0018967A61|nr:MarR family transcriptional regulator [Mesorhizobium sp. INR15]QPC91765.1 MarR family transcriptional regulator [Mesorhizobium sp. INR15]
MKKPRGSNPDAKAATPETVSGPAGFLADETSQTTTLWSLVELAVREIPRRFPEIAPDAMRLCMSLSCGADLVSYDISATIRERQGSVPVINPLLVLSLFEEIEMRDLTRLCNRSRAAISTIVDELFELGYVTRRISPDDRRVAIIKITPAGHEAFRRMFVQYNSREQYWAGALTAEEQKQFVTLLGKLVNSRLTDQDTRLRR